MNKICYFIDGTSIVKASKGREKLQGLLHLANWLAENKYPFRCYLAEKTFYELDVEIEQLIYKSLVELPKSPFFLLKEETTSIHNIFLATTTLNKILMTTQQDDSLDNNLTEQNEMEQRIIQTANELIIAAKKKTKAVKIPLAKKSIPLSISLSRTIGLSDIVRAKNSSSARKITIKPPHEYQSDIALKAWWNELSEDWKMAFNQCVLQKGEITDMPTIPQLRDIIQRQEIELIGNGILIFGLRQLTFQLKDISGLLALPSLKTINLSGNSLTSLKGISVLKDLEYINLTANQLTDLAGIVLLEKLRILVLQGNQLMNLKGIREIKNLTYLNVLYNKKLSSVAGVERLSKLEVFKIFSNKPRIVAQIERMKDEMKSVKISHM